VGGSFRDHHERRCLGQRMAVACVRIPGSVCLSQFRSRSPARRGAAPPPMEITESIHLISLLPMSRSTSVARGGPHASAIPLTNAIDVMNMKTIATRIAIAAAIGWGGLGCAGPATDSAPELPARIGSAETPNDHLAIAAHFAKEAARAREGAASHRKMARAYGEMRSSGHGYADMATHCNSLADLYESIATDFDKLALGHTGMAGHAAH
jgi:hypothetical protein